MSLADDRCRSSTGMTSFRHGRRILKWTPVNRVVGDGQLVDELHVTFSPTVNWFLPNVSPTDKKIAVDFVVVVQFRGDKLACERIYWDHTAVLRQGGLLKE
jgi:carboxymethylenebutenolidase